MPVDENGESASANLPVDVESDETNVRYSDKPLTSYM